MVPVEHTQHCKCHHIKLKNQFTCKENCIVSKTIETKRLSKREMEDANKYKV